MSDIQNVYFDNNATTPLYPEVVEAMLPYYKDTFGNASSAHQAGRKVKAKISEAREVVASALGASPSEIFFTSGGTEADNLAIKGYAWAKGKGSASHIITSTIEHPAVLEVCKYLSKNGYEITKADVDANAIVDLNGLQGAIKDTTILISIMHANNEVGTIEPIKEIAEIAKEKGIAMHTDAVQSFCKIPVKVDDLGVDLLSVSAHKINGPKGTGALYIRKGTKMHPLAHGGHHEGGLRAGTENPAGIAGFAKAVEIGMANMDKNYTYVKALRDDLGKRLLSEIPNTILNGHPDRRLPGTVNITFECVEGESLLINLDMMGIAISTGSACSSGSLDPSHVLMAMGIPHEKIHGSLRFSIGHQNTQDDVDYVMDKLPKVITLLRDISPLWNSREGRAITLAEAEKGARTL